MQLSQKIDFHEQYKTKFLDNFVKPFDPKTFLIV